MFVEERRHTGSSLRRSEMFWTRRALGHPKSQVGIKSCRYWMDPPTARNIQLLAELDTISARPLQTFNSYGVVTPN